MASGPHTFVTMVVFSPTKFEGSRHLVVSPRGPPNHPPLLSSRKARIAAEFNLSSTTYLYDLPIPPSPTTASALPSQSSTQHTARRLEIFRPLGSNKGVMGAGSGEIAFEPGAVLAAAHYLCTYIDRSPFWSYLPRGQEEGSKQQRLAFWLPKLQEAQGVLAQETGQKEGKGRGGGDGRVNVIFNPYRQVAAVAVPSVSQLFRVHERRVPLKAVLETQPQVKIVPEYESLISSKGGSGGCPVVSLGRDMHFILVDVSVAPNMLGVLTSSPGAAKSLDERVKLDDEVGWGAEALKEGYLGTVWFIRGKKDLVQGEATIENLRCRVFGDVSGWEEEGLGSGAAAVGGWLSLIGDGDQTANEGSGESLVEEVKKLKVEDEEETATGASRDAEGGAEITPKQTRTQLGEKEKVERKVFGIQTGIEIHRDSTVAVEVDVVVGQNGQRRLGGMVVSGRANFEAKGELLGA